MPCFEQTGCGGESLAGQEKDCGLRPEGAARTWDRVGGQTKRPPLTGAASPIGGYAASFTSSGFAS